MTFAVNSIPLRTSGAYPRVGTIALGKPSTSLFTTARAAVLDGGQVLGNAGRIVSHSKPLLRVGGKLVRKIPYVGLAIGLGMDGYELYKAKTEGGDEEFKKELKGAAIEWGCTAVGAAIGAVIAAACTEGLGAGAGAEIGGTVGAFVGMFLRGKTFTERQEEQQELAQQNQDQNNRTTDTEQKPKPKTTGQMFATLRCTNVPGIYCQKVDDAGGYSQQKHYFYDMKRNKFVEIPNMYYIGKVEDIDPKLRAEFLANGLYANGRDNYKTA